MANGSIVQKAWDATRGEGDAPFAQITNQAHLDDLNARVDGVRRTGLTINAFEEKVAELIADEKKENADSPLGTKNALGAATATAPAKEKEDSADEKPLAKMSRAELDEVAERELGLNPSDYSNKEEIVTAIEKARK